MAGRKDLVRIGCASGFWGDSAAGAPQLVASGAVDYLVFDYLAETTMSILAAQRAKSADQGYATAFVDVAMASVVGELGRRGIKVVSNAGGLNPRACAAALARVAAAAGVTLRVAVVEGDDLAPQLARLREAGVVDGDSGEALPKRLLSANAYLGALPIAEALAAGADVVVTGRCVDSALVLGPLLHEFGWSGRDHDLLAAGSLAGHVVECGCQATGGLYTDWEEVPDWPGIGYPIVECAADGTFIVTKPEGTGGLVTPAVVAEQLVYEIGDPSAYVLPDVVCDLREVHLEEAGPSRVRVTGARGRPPPDSYKVSATYADGWRATAALVIVGIDAARKARRTGEAILERTRGMLRDRGLGDYRNTRLEVLGAESLYGPHARAPAPREVVLRLAVHHASREALELFAREIAPAGTSFAPGTTGLLGGGRPSVSPLVKQLSFAVPKREVPVQVTFEGESRPVAIPTEGGHRPEAGAPPRAEDERPARAAPGPTVTVPLVRIAHARSGDKGDTCNVGVIARRPELFPVLLDVLGPDVVAARLAHLVQGEVRRYLLPGIHAVNFVLERALDGGGTTSLRVDPLGKSMAQLLLDMPVEVPAGLVAGSGETSPA